MDSEKESYPPRDGQPQQNPPQQGHPLQQSYPKQQYYPPQQPTTSYPQSNACFQTDPADCEAPTPYSTTGQQYQIPTTSYGQSMQSTVVVPLPGGDAAPVEMEVPPNHMALAWITCLCCFWPFGIAAIIQSCKVDQAVSRGDLVAAHSASRSSRRFSLIGARICTAICSVIAIIMVPLLVWRNINSRHT